MSKGIPYIRYVDGADDGCAIWQCLDCKMTWECRTPVRGDWPSMKYFKFCPYCGCEWKDEIKWDIKKKWDHGHGRHEIAKQARTERIRPLTFKIQKRFIPLNNDGVTFDYQRPGAWEYERNRLRDAIVAAQALKELNQEQDEEDDHTFGKFEYRIIPEMEK